MNPRFLVREYWSRCLVKCRIFERLRIINVVSSHRGHNCSPQLWAASKCSHFDKQLYTYHIFFDMVFLRVGLARSRGRGRHWSAFAAITCNRAGWRRLRLLLLVTGTAAALRWLTDHLAASLSALAHVRRGVAELAAAAATRGRRRRFLSGTWGAALGAVGERRRRAARAILERAATARRRPARCSPRRSAAARRARERRAG